MQQILAGDMSDDARTPIFGGPPAFSPQGQSFSPQGQSFDPSTQSFRQSFEQTQAFPPNGQPFNPQLSIPRRYSVGNGATRGRMGSNLQECEDNQCAEEGCDPETFGDENRAPAPARERDTVCGMDYRPALPLGLGGSTILSGIFVVKVHIPLLEDAFAPSLFFVTLYSVTLLAMLYTAFSDPGQIATEQLPMTADGKRALPRRSHKSWLYKYPIRRYDHYCRWVMNVIGLLNHRAFFLMCAGLMVCIVTGGITDLMLIPSAFGRSFHEVLILLLHFCYCGIVLVLLGPIFKLHVGFVSRNELAHEWTKDTNYIAYSQKRKAKIPVNDMDDEEFNEAFDFFEYDPSRNEWDKGCQKNCLAFWCVSRDESKQMGEF